MSSFSLRKTAPAPVPTPEPEPVPVDQTAPSPPAPLEPATDPAAAPASELSKQFRQSKVMIGLAVAFLTFWILADWTSLTAARMRPGQLMYSNEMAQLWTASYRLVFIVGVVVAIIKLTVPTMIRYWRRDVDPDFDASTDFLYHLTPHQRLWFSFALLFALCYLFIQLLSVRLPESLSVGL